MDTEVEVALASVGTGWALSTLSTAVGSFRRGREAERAAEAAKLTDLGALGEELLNAINTVDLASNDVAAQHSGPTRLVAGAMARAELVDGYRQDRPARGMARALDKTLEFDRLGLAAGRDLTGPLSTLTAAHLRLTRSAVGFPKLAAAADDAATAARDLARTQLRGRAAEQRAARDAYGEAISDLAQALRRLNEPKPTHWSRLLTRSRPHRRPSNHDEPAASSR